MHVGPLLIAIMKIIRGAVRVKGCAVVSGKMAALPVQKFVTIHHLLPSFDLQIFCRELRELAMHEFFFNIDLLSID